MKAISLWEPWALLVALKAKRFETRSWKTDYRGPLVIHAAAQWGNAEKRICQMKPFRDVLEAAGYGVTKPLPLRCALCIVDLAGIYRTEELLPLLREKGQYREIEFGNYGPNRYAWRLENVRLFDQPIPVGGRQLLWEFDNSLIPVLAE